MTEQIKVVDIRALDGKIRPTISGPMAVYIRDLLATGLYGNRETDVVRTLVRESIIRAMPHLIKPRDFRKKNIEQPPCVPAGEVPAL